MSNNNIEKIINLASKDPEKGARVVAKAFYRILRKNNFTENQVINIATNILNCLTESLIGYEEKVEKTTVIRVDDRAKFEPTVSGPSRDQEIRESDFHA